MQLRRSQKRALAASSAAPSGSSVDVPETSVSAAGAAPVSSDEPEPVVVKKRREAKPTTPAKTKKTTGATKKSSSIPIVPIVAAGASLAQFPLLSALKERRQGRSADDEKILYTYEHLVPGRLLRRYKRFLADIELVDAQQEPNDKDDVAAINEANVVTVYCPNTGPMVGLLDLPNARVQLSKSDDPKRKYQYTLEMIQVDNGERRVWVGVHSTLANRMVEKAIAAQWLPELGLFSSFQREVKFATNSRVDFVLSTSSASAIEESEAVITHEKYVEVKSVSFAHPIDPVVAESVAVQELLVSGEAEPVAGSEGSRFCALFPDTISERAQKHVTELTELIQSHSQKESRSKKMSAAIVFLVQRDDCHEFAPSFLHDVRFAKLCAEAKLKGIQLLAYAVALEPNEAKQRGHVRLLQALPLYERNEDEGDSVETNVGTPTKKTTKRAKAAKKS
ncbi:Sugar fermentation stimulation protein [Globisporangium polare]